MSTVSSDRPVTVPEFRSARARGHKLVVVTGYDYSSARLLDQAGVDAILVGDSLGMVVQGHGTSLPVTLRDMIYHTQCVVRGTRRALVIADLPFMSYQVSTAQAVRSAGKLIKHGGAAAVKLEGGEHAAAAVAACVHVGIPVMGHIGLTPQAVHQMGGFKVQRNDSQLVADARAIAQAGAFALVVEGVPSAIASKITQSVDIPTIGIGAGPDCDGQVLVFHDMLGLFTDFRPKFVKRYADLGEQVRQAMQQFAEEVRAGTFPGPEHSFS